MFLITLQAQEITDTLSLPQIEIHGYQYFLSNQLEKIDSLKSKLNCIFSPSELIKKYPSVFLKEYSANGIKTISFRGTSAQHSSLQLMGFPSNSTMSYQPELQHVPTFLFDFMQIIAAPRALFYTHDAVGGLIELISTPDTSSKTQLIFHSLYGNYKTKALASSLTFNNNNKFYSRTNALFNKSKNNYRFINNALPNYPIENRINAGYSNFYVGQENVFLFKNFSIHNFLLFSDIYQELPSSILSTQIDKNEIITQNLLNNFTSIETNKRNSKYAMYFKFGLHRWHYNNKNLNIDDTNTIKTLGWRTVQSYQLSQTSNLTNEFLIYYTQVQSPNYIDKPQNTLFKYRLQHENRKKLFQHQKSIHLIYLSTKRFDIAGMSGWYFYPIKNKMIHLIFGRSVRHPSFNELYWNPGGNPFLKSEKGYHIQSGLDYVLSNFAKFFVQYSWSRIVDWILWLPTENVSIWSPINVRKVFNQTIENGIHLKTSIGKFNLEWLIHGSKMRCIDVSDKKQSTYKKQLIYVPLFQLSNIFEIKYLLMKFQLHSSYTGKRFTRYDNSSYMPPFFNHNCTLEANFRSNKYSFSIYINVWNLTNENYQIIAWYPMPKRYITTGIKFKL